MSGPEERKVRSLSELSAAIEPPRDLWPEIEARLKSAAGAAAPRRRARASRSCAGLPPPPWWPAWRWVCGSAATSGRSARA